MDRQAARFRHDQEAGTVQNDRIRRIDFRFGDPLYVERDHVARVETAGRAHPDAVHRNPPLADDRLPSGPGLVGETIREEEVQADAFQLRSGGGADDSFLHGIHKKEVFFRVRDRLF